MDDEPSVYVILPERAVRALHTAVTMTLEKWTGQGDVDQEELFKLKYFFQRTQLEFQLDRQFDD